MQFPINSIASGQRSRKGAGFNHYRQWTILHICSISPGGEDATATEAEPPTFWSDALSYQAPASLLPAAAIGGSARTEIGIDVSEETWAEVNLVCLLGGPFMIRKRDPRL